jgi:teichoic acid transport system permease protein
LRYRKQILKLAKSDLIKTYKGAALGWSWSIIKPAITIAIYYFAFAVGLRRNSDISGYPYFLYLLSGLVPWFYMSAMFTGGASVIRKYGYLVTKVRFPVSVIPTFASLSQLATSAFTTVLMMVAFMLFGKMPDPYWLQIPFYMLLSFVLFTIWSLFAGLVSVVSKDFMHLVQSVVMMLFWTAGIFYDVKGIQNVTLRRIMMFNPVTIIVNGYRDALMNKVWFWQQGIWLRNYVIVLAFMLILALWAYRKLIKTIPDML